MKIGYIRVSGDKQITDLQEDAMQREECDKIFRDKMSGKREDRPGFLAMLDFARPGDVIVVWRLDRLGRTLGHLIQTVKMLEERKIELRSMKEDINTTTPGGKLMFHLIGAMAEFERDVISERTHAGLEAARARGRRGGRPNALDRIPANRFIKAKELYAAKEKSIDEILMLTKLKRSTFYKYVVNEKKGA